MLTPLNSIMLDGDQVIFLPAFPPAMVTVQPGKLSGSGKTKIKGKKICLKGDEKKVKVANCMYMTPSFPVPGMGTLTIKKLMPNQLSKKAKHKKKILLKGTQFQAEFKVDQKAQLITPGGPVQDPMPQYMGFGMLMPSNSTTLGS